MARFPFLALMAVLLITPMIGWESSADQKAVWSLEDACWHYAQGSERGRPHASAAPASAGSEVSPD